MTFFHPAFLFVALISSVAARDQSYSFNIDLPIQNIPKENFTIPSSRSNSNSESRKYLSAIADLVCYLDSDTGPHFAILGFRVGIYPVVAVDYDCLPGKRANFVVQSVYGYVINLIYKYYSNGSQDSKLYYVDVNDSRSPKIIEIESFTSYKDHGFNPTLTNTNIRTELVVDIVKQYSKPYKAPCNIFSATDIRGYCQCPCENPPASLSFSSAVAFYLFRPRTDGNLYAQNTVNANGLSVTCTAANNNGGPYNAEFCQANNYNDLPPCDPNAALTNINNVTRSYNYPIENFENLNQAGLCALSQFYAQGYKNPDKFNHNNYFTCHCISNLVYINIALILPSATNNKALYILIKGYCPENFKNALYDKFLQLC